jgi:ketosteroid isomerase-like protein
MSQENVELVREMFEPFSRGDFSGWTRIPDDFELVTSPEVPEAGTYRGQAATRWMLEGVEFFEGRTIEAAEILDAGGDKVLAEILIRGRPRGSQTAVEGHWWIVMTLRGGEVARIEVFPKRAQALEAAGLPE